MFIALRKYNIAEFVALQAIAPKNRSYSATESGQTADGKIHGSDNVANLVFITILAFQCTSDYCIGK